MRDFTLNVYANLLKAFIGDGYSYATFAEFIRIIPENQKTVILRHDVDKKPRNSVRMAELESELGIRGSYYFRAGEKGFPRDAIRKISSLGHEVGYHYEDLNAVGRKLTNALDRFMRKLSELREITPVETACMHGSPLFKFDNRAMWENQDYRDFGIIGEPYFDLDFNRVLYLTDTGRRWDGERVSIRDRVSGKNGLHTKYKFKKTFDIIRAVDDSRFPGQAMLTVHPQRWHDDWLDWTVELVGQRLKNIVKRFVIN